MNGRKARDLRLLSGGQQAASLPILHRSSSSEVLIAMAVTEFMYTRFFEMWVGLELPPRQQVITSRGSYVLDAYNQLAQMALEKPGWKKLLFIEQDHIVPPDIVERAKAWDAPITSALYFSRQMPPVPVCFVTEDEGKSFRHPHPGEVAKMLNKRMLYEMAIVPMGCTAIDREVLESVPDNEPFFATPTRTRNHPPGQNFLGHDAYFCIKAKERGFQSAVDSATIAKHLTSIEVDERAYLNFVAAQIASQRDREGDKVAAVDG